MSVIVKFTCIMRIEDSYYRKVYVYMQKEVLWNRYSPEQEKGMASVCSRYMTCLDEGKTERESARLTVSMAE